MLMPSLAARARASEQPNVQWGTGCPAAAQAREKAERKKTRADAKASADAKKAADAQKAAERKGPQR